MEASRARARELVTRTTTLYKYATREVQEAEQLLEVWNTAQLLRNTREAQEQV